jgi:hypothetical protein
MDILTLLGEDVGLWALQYHAVSVLDLPVCVWVGDHGTVHTDVIVVIEILEIFSYELSVIVDDDRVRDPKIENDVLDENHGLHGSNFSIHLVNLSTVTSRWVKPNGTFLKGLRRSRHHMPNDQVMGIV